LGAGPLSYEMVEPFRHWRGRVEGVAVETSTQAQIDGWQPGKNGGETVPVQLEMDIRSAVPPWESGTLLEEARRVLATQEEGALIPARVVEAPWLQSLEPKGQDVSVILATEDGRTATIRGETVLSTFHVMGPGMDGGFTSEFRLQQCVVQYTWDGETATGML